MTVSSVEAREVRIAGQHLRCQVCEYTRFFRREARLTTGASLFGQDWTNSKADCFVCEQCGYVHWFVRTRALGAAAEDSTLADEIENLRRRIEEDELAESESLSKAATKA
jgi:predicted nucleic-acid-binding Zn-ribbon protein